MIPSLDEANRSQKINRLWALVIGFGMVLSAIHSQWLTELVTDDGEVGFFLPAFGTAIWLMATLAYLVYKVNWKEIEWGDKRVFIPLFVIVASIGLSGISENTWGARFAPFLMGVSLFSLYLVSRVLGKDIFLAFIPFVVLVAISVIISGIASPGEYTGGLITNYCASVGFMIFGVVVNKFKWQWVLGMVALIGVFFVGALEAVFILAVLAVAVLVRRDFNIRLVITVAIIATMVGVWLILGYLTPLYEGNQNLVALWGVLIGSTSPLAFETLNNLTSGRWEEILNALHDIRFLGHGYVLMTGGKPIIHFVPLAIADQVGPLAAATWIWVTVYCLIKTRLKYAWIAVIAMSIFDHYIWTQFAPYWWALIGVSLASKADSDLIFKKVKG